MAQEFSFDVVSKVDLQEVSNAVQQASKEIATRFDFRGSKSKIEWNEKDLALTLISDDEHKLKSVVDILETRLVKRGIAVKSLDYQKIEAAALGTVRQVAKIQQGISSEKAKEIVKAIKDQKLKVQASIQADQVRVVGKAKDDLQAVRRSCAAGTSACRCSSRTIDEAERAMSPSPIENLRLKRAYDLISDKLARVEEELLLHFRSPIPTIDRIGDLPRAGRGQAHPAGPAAAVGAPARLPRGRQGRPLRRRGRVHPHGDPRPRRHHRRGHGCGAAGPPPTPGGATT